MKRRQKFHFRSFVVCYSKLLSCEIFAVLAKNVRFLLLYDHLLRIFVLILIDYFLINVETMTPLWNKYALENKNHGNNKCATPQNTTTSESYGTKYSRMDQVKFVEDSL